MATYEQIPLTPGQKMPKAWKPERPAGLKLGDLAKIEDIAQKSLASLSPYSQGEQGKVIKFENAGDELYRKIAAELPSANMAEVASYLKNQYGPGSPFRNDAFYNIVSRMTSGATFKPRESEGFKNQERVM